MMKILHTLIVVVNCALLTSPCSALIADFDDYANEVNDKGVTLLSQVKPFMEYNLATTKTTVRIVIVGAVINPGVYVIDSETTLENAVKNANPIKIEGYNVVAYLNKVVLFRKGDKESKIALANEGAKLFCIDGDVVKVRAVKL